MAKVELSRSSEWELENESQDVRGWDVLDGNGQRLGTVRDLIIDTEEERVSSIVLDSGIQVAAREVTLGDHVVRVENPSALGSTSLSEGSTSRELGQTSSMRPSSIEDPSLREPTRFDTRRTDRTLGERAALDSRSDEKRRVELERVRRTSNEDRERGERGSLESPGGPTSDL